MAHLVHGAYVSLLQRGDTYEDEDWEQADKWQRHAINAALDLRDARAELAKLREERDALKTANEILSNAVLTSDAIAERAESALAEARRMIDKTGKILLDHLNDDDYEMSLAGLYAYLTEPSEPEERG